MPDRVYRNDAAAFIALQAALHGLESAAIMAPDLAKSLLDAVRIIEDALDTIDDKWEAPGPVQS
jgi:hypothetical protein